HVDPVLHVAVGARLGYGGAWGSCRNIRVRGLARRVPALESRPPHGGRHDGADGDAHAAVDLLPQLQVRLLAAPRPPPGAARGARARLFLPRLVRAVGRVGGNGARDPDGMADGVARGPGARPGPPLAARDT